MAPRSGLGMVTAKSSLGGVASGQTEMDFRAQRRALDVAVPGAGSLGSLFSWWPWLLLLFFFFNLFAQLIC